MVALPNVAAGLQVRSSNSAAPASVVGAAWQDAAWQGAAWPGATWPGAAWAQEETGPSALAGGLVAVEGGGDFVAGTLGAQTGIQARLASFLRVCGSIPDKHVR